MAKPKMPAGASKKQTKKIPPPPKKGKTKKLY